MWPTFAPTWRTALAFVVEWDKLMQRQSKRCLARSIHGFAKEIAWLDKQLWLGKMKGTPHQGQAGRNPIPSHPSEESALKFRLTTLAMATALAFAAIAPQATAATAEDRQAQVATRGAKVMPFDLDRTRHVFTKTATGGEQRVVALAADDAAQATLIRAHLKDIAERFAKGDFSGPAFIHGEDMPGLAELRRAQPGQWTAQYREVENGGEIVYASSLPALVQAIHAWFDAQVSDHGRHAQHGQRHGQQP